MTPGSGAPILTYMVIQDSVIDPALGSVQEISQPTSPRVETLAVLTEHQCLDYLRSRDLGRVAFQIDQYVDVFPVNYTCDGSTVIFRTASLTRLQRAPQVRVTFEADSWDPVIGLGWSVVLKGVAREVTGGSDPFSKALRQNVVLPLAPGTGEHWIAIYPSEITGRRFCAPAC